jgi:hypothetical protein
MDGNRPGALRNAAKAFRETGRNAAKAFRETLSDETLDRELDAALNVAPSPEFVARVRMRVASEPAAAPWWTSWKLVTAGACVVLLGVALAVWSRPELTSPAGPSIATDRTLPPAVVEPAPTEVSRRIATTESRPRRRVDVTANEIVMTEVIVSPDDRHGFEALLLAIREQRVLPLTAEDAFVDESLMPAPIAIADVIIEPVEISRLE